MPLFTKKAAKKEASKDQRMDSKSSLAMAYAQQRRKPKKMAQGGGVGDSKYMTGAEHDAIGRKRQAEKAARETGASTNTGDLTTPEQEMKIRKEMKKGRRFSEGGMICTGESCQGCEDSACFARGTSSQDENMSAPTTVSAMDDARNEAQMQKMIRAEHDREAFAEGGEIRSLRQKIAEMDESHPEFRTLSERLHEAKKRAGHAEDHGQHRKSYRADMDSEEAFAMGGSIADRIRQKRMDAGYKFDVQDQIEHPNYYDDLNADIADEKLYDNDYGTDPWDSNESGDRLEDEDEHDKSMFKKIKMKKAQKGDRGNY